jgi:hypothetical protein
MVPIVANSLYIGSLSKIKWHYDRGVKKWYYYGDNKEVFYDGEQDVVIEVNQEEEDEGGIFVHIDACEPENVKECEVDEELEDLYAHTDGYVSEDKKNDWRSEYIHLPACINHASYHID